MRYIIKLFLIISWICGIVIAKGFWSTFFAVLIPLWSYYLVVETLLTKYGLV